MVPMASHVWMQKAKVSSTGNCSTTGALRCVLFCENTMTNVRWGTLVIGPPD